MEDISAMVFLEKTELANDILNSMIATSSRIEFKLKKAGLAQDSFYVMSLTLARALIILVRDNRDWLCSLEHLQAVIDRLSPTLNALQNVERKLDDIISRQ